MALFLRPTARLSELLQQCEAWMDRVAPGRSPSEPAGEEPACPRCSATGLSVLRDESGRVTHCLVCGECFRPDPALVIP